MTQQPSDDLENNAFTDSLSDQSLNYNLQVNNNHVTDFSEHLQVVDVSTIIISTSANESSTTESAEPSPHTSIFTDNILPDTQLWFPNGFQGPYLSTDEFSTNKNAGSRPNTRSIIDDDLPDTQPFSSEESQEASLSANAQHIPTPAPSPNLLPAASSQIHTALDACLEDSTSPPKFGIHPVDIDGGLGQATINSPANKVSCRERKRAALSSDRPTNLTNAMKQWVNKTCFMLDPFREDDECWLHPTPPAPIVTAAGSLRPFGKIQKRFNWHDRHGKHSIILNFGLVSKLINFEITKQEEDGYINHRFHLSHLCGNWTCINQQHTTIEAGTINVSRNSCFSHRSGCLHNPKCMKERKVALGPDGKVVDHNALANSIMTASAAQDVDWADWSYQNYDDDAESMILYHPDHMQHSDLEDDADTSMPASEDDPIS